MSAPALIDAIALRASRGRFFTQEECDRASKIAELRRRIHELEAQFADAPAREASQISEILARRYRELGALECEQVERV